MLRALHLVSEQMGAQVVAIALSGRAAKRISELTGRHAMTIAACLHSIRSGSLRLGADSLVIVDETSMLDLPTAYRLFRLVPEHVRFLFVGDPYQLPPIGFGLTFHLWVEAGTLPMVTLAQVHRQTSDSTIPVIANAIRERRVPCLDAYRGRRDGVSLIEATSERIVDLLPRIVSDLGSEACQILSPLRRGVAGTETINAHFHHLISPGRNSVAAGRICERGTHNLD